MNDPILYLYVCEDCGKTVRCAADDAAQIDVLVFDWEDLGDSGCRCFECRPKFIPQMSQQQVAKLAAAAVLLLDEIEDSTVSALRQLGASQHADDLAKRANELSEALTLPLQDGLAMLFAVAKDGPSDGFEWESTSVEDVAA